MKSDWNRKNPVVFFVYDLIRNEVIDLYSPYGYNYPYPAQQTSFQQIQQRQEIVQISGENGAKAYPLPPNSSVLLLDNSAPLVWLKTTDGAGFPTVAAYSITPYKNTAEIENTLEKRVERLEAILNESNSKQHQSDRTNNGND